LVTLFIEQTLLDIGKPAYDKVVGELERKYHCYLPDCYDHPEYLRNVLYELFEDADRIVESITKEMDEWKRIKKIADFVDVLRQ
jgi:hypothetical protein